jgi:hypothetical protein
MIADNRLTEIAAWDDRLLAQQLRELSLLGLDFDVTITGFDVAEIDLRIASLEDLPETDNDPAEWYPRFRPTRRLASSAICGSSVAIASCAAMLSIPRPSECCWATNMPRWCSPTRPTTCRSKAT